ncbi:hypothetical protein Tco_0491687 [Tanacetum coccineum]
MHVWCKAWSRSQSMVQVMGLSLRDGHGLENIGCYTGGSGVSTGSRPVSSSRGQREGKAPMIVEETQAPKRTKEQIQQEDASLAEAIRLHLAKHVN